MKEAAGEANMTIVTIVLIAIVLAAGTIIVTSIVNSMKSTSDSQQDCIDQGQVWNPQTQSCVDAAKLE